MPRDHHFRFAKILIPQMVSSNPDRMFEELTGPKREAFLMFLWQEAGKESRDGTLPHVDTVPLAPGQPAQMTKLDSLGSSKVGAYEIVFLTMPAALQPNEALYIALVREGRTPRVFFWERCMGNAPGETHPSECVCSAVDGMGGRTNYGFHAGLAVDDFRRVLSQVLGVDVPAPVAGPGMEAVMGASASASSGFERAGHKSWGGAQSTPQPTSGFGSSKSGFASSGGGFASSGPLASPVGGAPGSYVGGASTQPAVVKAPLDRKKALTSALVLLGALFLYVVTNFTYIPVVGILGTLGMAAAAGILYRPGTTLPIVSACCFAAGLMGAGMLPMIVSIPVAAVAWGTLAWSLGDAMPKPQLAKSIGIGVGILTLLNGLGMYFFYEMPDLPMLVFWCRLLMMGAAGVIVAVHNK